MKVSTLYIIALIATCLLVAGPELAIGLELFVLIDAFGIELIILSITASLWNYWYFVKAKLEELDPYFFISSSKDMWNCPALLAHAILGSMGLFMYALAITAIAA